MEPLFLAGITDGYLAFREDRYLDQITLDEDLVYRDSLGEIWIAPRGLCCDGASIPRLLWTLVGHPLQARHMPAALLHDQSYQTGFRLTVDPEVLALVILGEMSAEEIVSLPRVEVLVDRAEVDRHALLEPLLANGNSFAHARVIYRGVRLGGWHAWDGHVARRAAERIPFSRLPNPA